MTEYGRIHTDGSRSGGQPVVDNAMLEVLQKDAGLPHLPTRETYQFRMAVSGEGPLAYQWSDKPHRLLYNACSIIESEAAQRTYSNVVAACTDRIGGAGGLPCGVVGVATQSDANERLGAWLSAALDDPNCSEAFKQDINDWFASQPTQSDALRDQLLQECLVKLRDVQGTEAPKQYACNLIKRIERVLQEQNK